jgi:hypothetical protein
MKIKKAQHKAPLILSVEEHRRVTQFVDLLFTIDRRIGLIKQQKAQKKKNTQRLAIIASLVFLREHSIME